MMSQVQLGYVMQQLLKEIHITALYLIQNVVKQILL